MRTDLGYRRRKSAAIIPTFAKAVARPDKFAVQVRRSFAACHGQGLNRDNGEIAPGFRDAQIMRRAAEPGKTGLTDKDKSGLIQAPAVRRLYVDLGVVGSGF